MNSEAGRDIPRAIEIEINHGCNRKCSYCPNSSFDRKTRGRIAPEILDQLLLELREIGFSGRVSYDFYNEPLLHPNFEEIVRDTRRMLEQATIEIYTNGTLLTAHRFRSILAAGASRFVVTRHEHEENYQFERTFGELTEEEKSQVHYRPHTELRLTNRGGTLPHLGSGLPVARCFIPSFVVTVTNSGNVLPCFEDFHENQVMGNLRNQTLMDIWNSEKYVFFRKSLRMGQRLLHSPCASCNRTEVLLPVSAE